MTVLIFPDTLVQKVKFPDKFSVSQCEIQKEDVSK